MHLAPSVDLEGNRKKKHLNDEDIDEQGRDEYLWDAADDIETNGSCFDGDYDCVLIKSLGEKCTHYFKNH